MTITVTVGAPIEELDLETARRTITRANRRRETPLPSGTTAETKASLETVLAEQTTQRWQSQVQQTGQIMARQEDLVAKFRDADEATRQAVRDLLNG